MQYNNNQKRPLTVHILAVTLPLFISGYFILPERYLQYSFYYLLVFIPAMIAAWQYRHVWRDRILIYTVAFIGYHAASVIWSHESDIECIVRAVSESIITLSFAFALFLLKSRHHEIFHPWLRNALVIIGITSVAYIFTYGPSDIFTGPRLESLAQFSNPNTIGVSYGLLFVLTAGLAFSSRLPATKVLYICLGIIFFSFVLISQSRNAAIASATGLSLLVAFYLRKGAWHLILPFLLSIIIVVWTIGDGLISRFSNITLHYRQDIWQMTISQAREAWLLGYGLCSSFLVSVKDVVFNHPHSAILATAWYTGIIGLLLLIAIFFEGLKSGWYLLRNNDEPLYMALLLYALLCLMPDFDILVSRPREIWLYFWFPVIMAVATCIGMRYDNSRFQHS